MTQVVPFPWKPNSTSHRDRRFNSPNPKTLPTHAEPGAHLAPNDQLLLLQAATERGRLHAVVGLPVGRGKAAQVEVPGRGQQGAVALPQSPIVQTRHQQKQTCNKVQKRSGFSRCQLLELWGTAAEPCAADCSICFLCLHVKQAYDSPIDAQLRRRA